MTVMVMAGEVLPQSNQSADRSKVHQPDLFGLYLYIPRTFMSFMCHTTSGNALIWLIYDWKIGLVHVHQVMTVRSTLEKPVNQNSHYLYWTVNHNYSFCLYYNFSPD